MNNFKENDFIDVDYTETKKDGEDNEQKIIRGEPLFYTTTQVAEMVGVEPSTIRFWTKRFENLLDVEISNKNKQYKRMDVEKLIFIKKLTKEDGLTLQQVEDYCSSKGFSINEIEQSVIDSSNPLAIQTFISAVITEMDKKFKEYEEELLTKIETQQKISVSIQQDNNEKLQEQVAYTVDTIVSEKLENLTLNIDKNINSMQNNIQEQLQTQMDTQEKKFIERDVKNIEVIKFHLEERKKENEIEQEKKKGFWNKWNIWFKK